MDAIRFEHRSTFEVPLRELWSFHLRPDALELLTPPLMGLAVEDRGSGVADGSLVRMKVGRWPLSVRWEALHCGVRPETSFTDIALRSPFPYWTHVHAVRAAGSTRSELRDVVWCVPPRWLPRPLAGPLTRFGLRLLFAWRHRRTRRILSGSTPVSRRSSASAELAPAEVKA
jgi:ligand-binding SRPBCC domain-containing protein